MDRRDGSCGSSGKVRRAGGTPAEAYYLGREVAHTPLICAQGMARHGQFDMAIRDSFVCIFGRTLTDKGAICIIEGNDGA